MVDNGLTPGQEQIVREIHEMLDRLASSNDDSTPVEAIEMLPRAITPLPITQPPSTTSSKQARPKVDHWVKIARTSNALACVSSSMLIVFYIALVTALLHKLYRRSRRKAAKKADEYPDDTPRPRLVTDGTVAHRTAPRRVSTTRSIIDPRVPFQITPASRASQMHQQRDGHSSYAATRRGSETPVVPHAHEAPPEHQAPENGGHVGPHYDVGVEDVPEGQAV